LDFFGHHGNEGFALVGGQQHLGLFAALTLQKALLHQLFNGGGSRCRGADTLTFNILRHTIRTSGFHSVQQGVLGKMLRRGRLPLFQFGVENAALVFRCIGQGSEFLFSVQDICQHLAFHRFPTFLQNLLTFGSKLLSSTFGGQQGFQIPEGFAHRHQRPGDDELQNVLLAFRQRFQIGLQHTAGGQDGVVVGDFFPVDGAPCPGHSLVHIFWGNVEKAFQFLGQHLQHFLVIVGDIAAISSGISGKFLLIQALHIVQRLLCAVPQQAVCIPLKGGQVVQRRRILRLFLAGDALDRCHHLLSTGFQQVFSNVFFRNAAAGCRAATGQFQIHRVEFLRHKGGNGGFPHHRHGKHRGHNTPHRQRLTVQTRKKPGRIDANHPVGTFPAECCIVQRIVFS